VYDSGMEPGTMTDSQGDAGATSVWILDVVVAQDVVVPTGETLDRDAFFGWLWDRHGDAGLLGVCEGALDAGEAATLGLSASARVLDAAAAPADRDWVGSLTDATVACWFAAEADARAAADALVPVRGCRVAGVRAASVANEDSDWRRMFVPIEVPGFGVVRPAWEEGPARESDGRVTIFIDPGAGFGTGLHETTQLCLAALAACRAAGSGVERVLDFGSGSGILGIAAAVLGAMDVASVEIDDRVHDAIQANAARNGVADRVHVAAAIAHEDGPYDLVLANIVADVLVTHADELVRCVRGPAGGREGGRVVLSGLLADDVPAVVDRFAPLLGELPTITAAGEWRCLRFARRRQG
jgi:ribosomal protein L11 methyltransferase